MLKKIKIVIIWSLLYWFSVYLIFLFLFNFNLFINNWGRVLNLRLDNVSDFSFFLLFISCIPIYVSSVIFSMRKEKYLISFFENKKKEVIKPEEKKEEVIENQSLTISKDLPFELTGAFLIAKKRNFVFQESTKLFITKTNDVDKKTDDFIPVPDFFSDEKNDFDDMNIPSFKDIDFDKLFKDDSFNMEEDDNEIANFLEDNDKDYKEEGGIIIYNHYAILKYNKESIDDLLEFSKKNKLEPLVYINDEIDEDINLKELKSMGLKIIFDLNDIL